jgi:hypothetical protein
MLRDVSDSVQMLILGQSKMEVIVDLVAERAREMVDEPLSW